MSELPGGGGLFSSQTNAAGGQVWTSTGAVNQNDFMSMVNGGLYSGDVNILSGAHGNPDGTFVSYPGMYEFDQSTLGTIPGVNVYNFPDMSPGQINDLLNGPGTTIGGFCNSAACLAPYK